VSISLVLNIFACPCYVNDPPIFTETTIDHGTLSRLMDAGAIRAGQVIGQGGG
jgi:hypothetical protein